MSLSTANSHSLPRLGLSNVRPLDGFLAQEQSRAVDAVAQLTRGLVKGDESAFRAFHACYFDRLHQFLLVVARGNEHEAREALQETFVRVARNPRAFDDVDAFWCWLKAVARNAARDAGRKRSRYTALLESFSSIFRQDAPIPNPDGDSRLAHLLGDCLAQLEATDRAILEGKYLQGATVVELASTHNLSIKSVESRLARLRKEVREKVFAKLRQP